MKMRDGGMMTQEEHAKILEDMATHRGGVVQASLKAGATTLRNEAIVFKRLSMMLTQGNASTWDEVFDMIEHLPLCISCGQRKAACDGC